MLNVNECSWNDPNIRYYRPHTSIELSLCKQSYEYDFLRDLCNEASSRGYGWLQHFDYIVEKYLEVSIDFLDMINQFHYELGIDTHPPSCIIRHTKHITEYMHISRRSEVILERIAVGLLFDNLSQSASYIIKTLIEFEQENNAKKLPKRPSVEPVTSPFDVVMAKEKSLNGYVRTEIGWLEQQRLRREQESLRDKKNS